MTNRAVLMRIAAQPTNAADRNTRGDHASDDLAVWQLNRLRAGYAVLAIGLAVGKWRDVLDWDRYELKAGTVDCLLTAMSLLALVGLRYPRRMIPILLFEVTWKTLWLAAVALPLWLDGDLRGATREQADAVLWVVVIVAAIPWRHVLSRCVRAAGDPWR